MKITEYVSVGKTAEILGISIPAVFAANYRGSLMLYEIDFGINVVKLSDVEEYKKNRKSGRPWHKIKKQQ